MTNPTPEQIVANVASSAAINLLNDAQVSSFALIVEALEDPANGWHWSSDGMSEPDGDLVYLVAWPNEAEYDDQITVTVDEDGTAIAWKGYAYEGHENTRFSPAHVGAINALDDAWDRYYPTHDADPIDHADGDV